MNLPSSSLLSGYSGYDDLQHSLHSVQTLKDKKNEAIPLRQHTLLVVSSLICSHSFSLYRDKFKTFLSFNVYMTNIGGR